MREQSLLRRRQFVGPFNAVNATVFMLDNPIAWAALICFVLGLALSRLIRLSPAAVLHIVSINQRPDDRGQTEPLEGSVHLASGSLDSPIHGLSADNANGNVIEGFRAFLK
jgi:hypothetical protein